MRDSLKFGATSTAPANRSCAGIPAAMTSVGAKLILADILVVGATAELGQIVTLVLQLDRMD